MTQSSWQAKRTSLHPGFQFHAPMSYHELPRRELQARCKTHGLPANKSNAAMASSLISFLGDPRTNILASALQVLPAAKKSIKAKALPKLTKLDTSLASLILEATVFHPKTLKSKPMELYSEERKRPIVADLSGFINYLPTKHAGCVPQPKSTPFLRRRKNSDATHSTDRSRNLSVLHEEISMHGSGTVVKKLSAPELQLVPFLDAADLGTCNEGPIELVHIPSPSTVILRDQDCQNKNKRCCEIQVQASLGHLFRISANVDNLVRQVTMMLAKFDEWKDIYILSTDLETH